MSKSNKIEVSFGGDGAKVTLEGDVAKGASRGFGDLLKPLVEYLGSKGDAIEHQRRIRQQIRVFNEEALRLALESATEKASSSKIQIQPVPLKFLAQWAEGASLEDENSETNLTDLWSNLLLSASSASKDPALGFITILKELGYQEASVFNKIASDLKLVDGHDPIHSLSKYVIDATITMEMVELSIADDNVKEQELLLSIQDRARRDGIVIYQFDMFGENFMYETFRPPLVGYENMIIFELLVRQGLLSAHEFTEVLDSSFSKKELTVHIKTIGLTSLGKSFFESVSYSLNEIK